MNWIVELLKASEREADSLVVGCLAGALVVVLVSAALAFLDHATWNPLSVSTGIATIFGAGHAAKGYRDRCTGEGDAGDPDPK